MPTSTRRRRCGALSVNDSERIVCGAALIELGPLRLEDDRPWIADRTTLQQVLMHATLKPTGLKARFTHPTKGVDGLANFLGRWRRPRMSRDRKAVLADLHLADAAFVAGNPRGPWVLSMASEAPDAFGVSIYPILDTIAMDRAPRVDGRQPLRMTGLIAADLIDEPAANHHGLFGALSVATLDLTSPTGELEVRQQLGSSADTFFAAVAEYGDNSHMLRRRGVGVLDYAQSALNDIGGPELTPKLQMALRRRQEQLGWPHGPAESLLPMA